MPLPIAHSLGGVAIWKCQSNSFFKTWRQNLLFFILLSNLPDLDFLPGFLIGEPSLFHHGVSHSLGMAILTGLLGGAFFWRKKGTSFWSGSLVIGLTYYFHILLDYFTVDERLPFGMMMVWPFSNEYYISNFKIFDKMVRSDQSGDFFQSLFCMTNFWVALKELLIMGLFVGGIFFLKGGKLTTKLTKYTK